MTSKSFQSEADQFSRQPKYGPLSTWSSFFWIWLPRKFILTEEQGVIHLFQNTIAGNGSIILSQLLYLSDSSTHPESWDLVQFLPYSKGNQIHVEDGNDSGDHYAAK